MPEGPSIVILKEMLRDFRGGKVTDAAGSTTKVNFERIRGQRVTEFKSWGKQFLICFKDFSIRIHLLMFGSYRINEDKEKSLPRLRLVFSGGEYVNFYACAVTTIETPLDEVYDWTADVMNVHWSAKAALKKLDQHPSYLVCDALLDQHIFSGVGNIIKNEVLFRIKVHPKTKLANLPGSKKKELIREAVNYSFQFLEWKKANSLKANWLVHTKKKCPRDKSLIVKEYFGKTKRRSFFCKRCQKLYK